MNSIGIKYQLRITTLIPVFVVALLFALFYNGQFSRDQQQQNFRLGEAYIRQLLPAAQLALLRDDTRTLQGLIDASTINPEIQSLAFYNNKRQLLAYRGGKHSLKNTFHPPEYTGDYIESKHLDPYTINFIAPITVPKFNLYSAAPLKTPTSPIDFQADDILGWLSIDIDIRSTIIKRYQMYIVTIVITLLGLLIGLSIHYFLSKRIYIPIARLRRSMKQILSNAFETDIKVSSAGELGTIEQGCAHLQKQYLSINQDLNQYIETATADLQKNLEFLEEKNIELSLDKKKTEEKSRQKSEFIANMSHEIRTPMNGVIGFANVLLESKLDALQLDYVKTIRSSAQDLLTIINDILDYSKIDAGKLNLDCIPVDLRACIDDVLALTAPNAHKKGIDLIPATAIEVPKTVLGDPIRLKQIISNLIQNAIKFTDHGYVSIRTHIVEESEKDYSICLSVSDTGIGIAPEDQATLFNAFNQADTTITRRYGGSGLGLVICKKLAEHMQGRITLTSEVHKGSTFSVYLKLEKLAAYEIEKNQVHRFSHLKALCFDENPLYLEAICNGLGYWGIKCHPVDNFHELPAAFAQYQTDHIAFIGLNQTIEPPMTAILKQQTIPCVLVSKTMIPEFYTHGADAFLFKPPNIQKLHDTIESLMNHTALHKHSEAKLDVLRTQLRALNLNLLVAEDNPVNRMLLNSLLDKKAKIQTVHDGEQAVDACNHERFDVILLDLQMPKLNGLDAACLIRQKSMLNKETPMILISANISDIDHEYQQKKWVDIFLQKPIDEAQLLHHILKVINQNQLPLIDWPLCIQKVSGNQALAAEFLDQFVEELELNRDEFLQLMAEKDIAGIERLAHKLHGACCFCGVPTLQLHVAQLETTAKQAAQINELQAVFNLVIQNIDEVLKEYERSYRKSIHA